jgi:hypothetical protein
MVTRLDRLARSTRDLLNTLAAITDRKAGFRSLGDAWADTTTSHGRLMLTVLGGLAEFERDLIRARTGEGRERAKARGVKMGRPPKLTPHQQRGCKPEPQKILPWVERSRIFPKRAFFGKVCGRNPRQSRTLIPPDAAHQASFSGKSIHDASAANRVSSGPIALYH